MKAQDVFSFFRFFSITERMRHFWAYVRCFSQKPGNTHSCMMRPSQLNSPDRCVNIVYPWHSEAEYIFHLLCNFLLLFMNWHMSLFSVLSFHLSFIRLLRHFRGVWRRKMQPVICCKYRKQIPALMCGIAVIPIQTKNPQCYRWRTTIPYIKKRMSVGKKTLWKPF